MHAGFIRGCLAALAGITMAIAGAAFAQDYPNRTVKFVVGFAAGGPTDVIARIVAQDLTTALGQSFVVENRPGANSLIGTEGVARSAPDGYTLMVGTLAHNINTILLPDKVKYHPLKDFVPISLVAITPLIAVTGYESPFNSVQDLVAAAKKDPGSITYGSAGNGGSAHLAAALLATRSNTQMTHVPFKGNAPAMTEVIAGRVSFMYYPMVGIAERVAQKQLKALAVTTPQRQPDFPSVPTMNELGYTGFDEYTPGISFLAPAGTPPAIISKLADAVRASLAKPETAERIRKLGAIPVGSTPAELADWLKRDYERWDRVIKAAGVKGE